MPRMRSILRIHKSVSGPLDAMRAPLTAPFPYFGGKRKIAKEVWARFGEPKQYIEPFCGSAAMLLAAPKVVSLEVIGDANGFIANFWRATKHQPEKVAEWADYPVSHVDLGARHVWLKTQAESLSGMLNDPDWPGDAKIAGWWLWGQCCWIGSGWCSEKKARSARKHNTIGQIPHISGAGMGVHAIGLASKDTDDAGSQRHEYLTSAGHVAHKLLRELSARLNRVRIVHGAWDRCLNHNYGGKNTAIFLDPPYKGYESVYNDGDQCIADLAAKWAAEHSHLKVAICGHIGDYVLPGWEILEWSRASTTYGSYKNIDKECVWFSPACLKV